MKKRVLLRMALQLSICFKNVQGEGEFGDPTNCAVYYRSVPDIHHDSNVNDCKGVFTGSQSGKSAHRDFCGTSRRAGAIGDTSLLVDVLK